MTDTTVTTVLAHVHYAARSIRDAIDKASQEPDALAQKRIDQLLLAANRLERLHVQIGADGIVRRVRRQA